MSYSNRSDIQIPVLRETKPSLRKSANFAIGYSLIWLIFFALVMLIIALLIKPVLTQFIFGMAVLAYIGKYAVVMIFAPTILFLLIFINLLLFGIRTKKALKEDDSTALLQSTRNLKNYFIMQGISYIALLILLLVIAGLTLYFE
jgi:hypothetical protein